MGNHNNMEEIVLVGMYGIGAAALAWFLYRWQRRRTLTARWRQKIAQATAHHCHLRIRYRSKTTGRYRVCVVEPLSIQDTSLTARDPCTGKIHKFRLAKIRKLELVATPASLLPLSHVVPSWAAAVALGAVALVLVGGWQWQQQRARQNAAAPPSPSATTAEGTALLQAPVALHLARRQAVSFNENLRAVPDNAAAYFDRGERFAQRGQLMEALTDFTTAIEHDPRHWRAYIHRARLLAGRGDWASALADCDRALVIQPAAAATWKFRGDMQYCRGRLAAAVADYTWAVALDPDNGDALACRALARSESGECAAGLDDAWLAVMLQPTNAVAANAVAWILYRADRWAEALVWATRAIELNSADANHHDTRGWIHLALGDLTLARADFQQATNRAPRSVAGFASRGILEFLDRQYPEAVASWTHAINLQQPATAFLGPQIAEAQRLGAIAG